MTSLFSFGCSLCLAIGMALQPMSAFAAGTSKAVPVAVTLGGVIHPASDDTLSFTPDGNTVFFDRGEGKHKTILVSHKVDGRWSQPRVAVFSGHWYDQDPALAPDGSYMVFSSDRPIVPGGKRLVREVDGKTYHGGNLWKVEWKSGQWSAPTWLGTVVNQDSFLVSPSIAADGTLYFIQQDHHDHAMHIFSSHRRGGRYLAPVRVALGDPATTTHDPAIAPDQSFVVFGYGKTAAGLGRLCIAFREGDHWSKPIDLGDAVNSVGPWGSHVLPDRHTLTFTGDTALYRLSLKPWLSQRGGHP